MKKLFLIVALIFSATLLFAQDKPATDKAAPDKPEDFTAQAVAKDKKAKDLHDKIDALEAKFKDNADDKTKAELVKAYVDFANYMTYDSPVSPRLKYRPALKAYNQALKLDAKNEDALKNKKQIEDIYTQMGMPIPKE
jgi:hypothetical protein